MSTTIGIVRSTSPAQFEAAGGETVPPLEEVRDGLFALGLRQPGTLPHYTLSYLVLDAGDGVHLVDPGWDSDENWRMLGAALSSLGRELSDIASITVTHLHPDHLGMAGRVRAASGAPVALHRLEQDGIVALATPIPRERSLAELDAWGVPAARCPELLDAVARRSSWRPFTADRLLHDGSDLGIPGRDLRVLHTPGHTTGHLAIVAEGEGVVLLGDLLLPNQFPGIGLGGPPGADPIGEYLASLRKVAALDALEALPGHGYRFTGLAERCEVTAAHHERRTAEVAAVLGSSRTVWEVASGLTWTSGWENLTGLQLLSALAQTALHRDRALRL
jgi:glyoxylase-like metal-dependent hydrolase (beta-lactamase superfamily II)